MRGADYPRLVSQRADDLVKWLAEIPPFANAGDPDTARDASTRHHTATHALTILLTGFTEYPARITRSGGLVTVNMMGLTARSTSNVTDALHRWCDAARRMERVA